jgi:hypothetical protein
LILYPRIDMAQTKRKRRSKHRGNAAGAIEARGRTSRPPAGSQPRQGAGKAARGANGRPPLKPATLKRAAIKAAGLAVLLFVLTQLGIFGRNQSVGSGLILAVLSFVLYTPLVFATDRWAYTRDQRRRGVAPAEPAGKRR